MGDKAVELASGTFVMDGNKLTLTSDGGDVQNLVKQGKYLIAKDYLYEGEIPDGDTFDATCTFKNSNNVVYSITFKADGTYVQDDNGDVSEGTYTRDGDWIKRESSSGTSVGIDYLIYSGRITNSYYIKNKTKSNGIEELRKINVKRGIPNRIKKGFAGKGKPAGGE